MKKQLVSYKTLIVSFVISALLFLAPNTMNAQGPNAPEAASFEPVDATDMVNLVTGDFSYVLPLLNIPSPQGGYPLALSYHAGIAMDQEASWVGLGWSLNPGAINRVTSGNPDDWKDAIIKEFAYDYGNTATSNSVSFGIGAPIIGSIGVGVSWGSHKSYGGHISAQSSFLNNSYARSSNEFNSDSNLFMTSGYDFNDPYSKRRKHFNFFFFSFGKNKLSWSLDKTEYQMTQGAMHLYNTPYNSTIEDDIVDNPYVSEADNKNKLNKYYDVNTLSTEERFAQGIETTHFTSNNSLFANLDNYSVSAEGIGGSIKPLIGNDLYLKNINFLELDGDEVGFETDMWIHPGNESDDVNSSLIKPVTFDFQGFSNSYFSTVKPNVGLSGDGSISFNSPTSTNAIPSTYTYSNNSRQIYLNNSFEETSHRRRKGQYVEYFTVHDVNSGTAAARGFLAEASGYELTIENCGYISNSPDDNKHRYQDTYDNSIAAYKITMDNGSTYHYSLPVYQIEQVRRIYGIVDNQPEDRAHIDRMQLNPYATHWLLTAITGPDYVKNDINRTFPDEGDYGYWVRFDYGKWSDGYIWKNPPGAEYSKNVDVFGKVKEYSWGRKQLYYLDKIKTATHTALFVKKLRTDSKSEPMIYKNLGWYKNGYEDYMDMDSHPLLALNEIILLKNEDATSVSKDIGADLVPEKYYSHYLFATGQYRLNSGLNFDYLLDQTAKIGISVNRNDSVLDVNDIKSTNIYQHAQKRIGFSHNYKLVSGAPNSDHGRLTLNNIYFRGKRGAFQFPPIELSYNSNPSFDFNKRSDFGYYENQPQAWSLTNITTPTGGEINVEYEPDSYNTLAINNGKVFTSKLKFTFLTNPLTNGNPSRIQIKVEIDNQDPTTTGMRLSDYFDASEDFFMDMWYSAIHNGRSSSSHFQRSSINIEQQWAEIISPVTQSQMTIEVTATSPRYRDAFQHNAADPVSTLYASGNFANKTNQNLPRIKTAWVGDGQGYAYSMRHTLIGNKFVSSNSSGLRVKKIALNNGVGNTYNTNYNYNNPTTGESSGVLPYYPEQDYNINQQAPYISLLPGPSVNYKYVTHTNYEKSTRYQFKALEEFNDTDTPGYITFGDLLKIKCTEWDPFSHTNVKFLTIYNKLSELGRLESMTSYNLENQILGKTINNYSNIEEQEFTLGQFKQSYHSSKTITDPYRHAPIRDYYYGNFSANIIQDEILQSTTTTQGGFTNTTNFTKHDLLTGQVLETETTDSKGTKFKTELIPAYTKTQYNPSGGYGMGSKVDNILNKNMLTQEAMSKSYKKVGSQWKETGVGITTWNNYWAYTNNTGVQITETSANKKIWRNHKSFVWDGSLNTDGTLQGFTNSVPANDDENFNWAVQNNATEIAQSNAKWKNISTTTLYDHYSMPLEVRDINNNYASTKMGDKDSKVFVTANAPYNAMFYSGAEDNNGSGQFSGAVHIGNGIENNTSHSGFKAVTVGAGQKTFVVKPKVAGKYKASVWAHRYAGGSGTNTRLSVNGALISAKEIIYAGNWIQLNFYPELSNTTSEVYITSLSGNTVVDDFRLLPIASSMTSYVYNQWDELSYIIGNNGLASKFEYDAAGRLTKTFTEVVDFNGSGSGGFKEVSKSIYHYKN